MRPPSIVTFERCYLAAFAIGLVNTLVAWPTMIAAMRASPAIAQMGPSFAPGAVAIGGVVSAAVTLLLWYFVARAGSAVAKWIVVVLFAFAALSLLYRLAMGAQPLNLQGIVGLAAFALNAAATAMLFRADTRIWFGETGDAAETRA